MYMCIHPCTCLNTQFLFLSFPLHAGSINGLPEGVKSFYNIHTLLVPSNETEISLNLTCNCSVYVPRWHRNTLKGEEGVNKFYNEDIFCVNRSRPCSETYIPKADRSEGLYVYTIQNFSDITENTALMCFSNKEREVLIVTFAKGRKERERGRGKEREGEREGERERKIHCMLNCNLQTHLTTNNNTINH